MLNRWMEKKWQSHRWLAHLGVTSGYILIYLLVTAMLSNAPWPFVAGLRITCLLLVPYCYWPALAFGEAVPFIYRNLEHINDWGLTAVLLSSIPPIVLAMPVVWWFRARAGLFPHRGLVDVKKLLCCVVALSVLWASTRYAALLAVRTPNGAYDVPSGTAFSFFIHFYLALLVVTPWVVMVRLYPREAWRPFLSWRVIATSPVMRDAAIAVVAFTVLTTLHRVLDATIKPVVMLVLFFPALGLALKHGWRASVLGGTLCLISVSLLVEWRPDLQMQQMQALIAFTMTGLYLFGAQFSTQIRMLEQLQQGTRQMQYLAKKSLASSEDRLQQTSQALECVAGILRADYTRIMQRFIPEALRDDYSKDFWNVQREVYHLAESIHPSAWRERGLAAALEETIGTVLREAGIAYSCETPGHRLRFLSEALQAALYRMACEAAATLSTSPACIGVHLALRTGRRHGIPWVTIRMDGMLEPSQVAYGVLQANTRRGVAGKLGARLKTNEELQHLARLFHGDARFRTTASGARFTALLSDTTALSSSLLARPVRLWAN